MPIEVKLPKLGEGIESGDVLEIFVREGEVIKANQDLLELETDKATVTVPSSHAGKIAAIHVKPGQSVPIGALLVTLEGTAAEAAPPAPKAPPKAAAPAAKPAAAPAPAKPATPTPAAEMPKPAAKPAAAPAAKPAAAPAPRPAPPAPVARAKPEPETQDNGGSGGAVAAGPAIRRFAREVGVDLHRVAGSGTGGRITRDDVLEVVRKGHRGSEPAAAASPAAAPRRSAAPATVTAPGEQGSDAWGPIRIEKMAKIRKTIAAKMHESWTTIPKVTNFDDADITELERIRQDTKDDYAAAGIKLSSMPFVIKACALALKNHPTVNASLDMENERIIYKDYVNIGIAVDSERGLVVPALRDADRLSIPEIARTLADLAERVRSNNYSIEDLRGGTFTISNLGAIGGTYSTPIINAPEVAILLTGRARKMPVVIDDKVEIRLMMPLSLSYDHRLIDGATAARFLNDLIGYLKAPSRLLLAP